MQCVSNVYNARQHQILVFRTLRNCITQFETHSKFHTCVCCEKKLEAPERLLPYNHCAAC